MIDPRLFANSRGCMNAMEFFQRSAGQWQSLRTTHHLAFRRTEKGESLISVEPLDPSDSRIIDICLLHQCDPTLAIGGAFVQWQGSMDWDQDPEENHTGSTVFALLPDDPTGRSGQLLRERGYAEIVPVIGRFEMDAQDALLLTTDYETMSATERFALPADHLRVRTSTVKRFGGFSTATFCTEFRIAELDAPAPTRPPAYFSLLGC